MTPEQVMRQVYGARGESVLQTAKDAAIKLAEAVEKNHRHTLGELGFDIGIDQNERYGCSRPTPSPAGRSSNTRRSRNKAEPRCSTFRLLSLLEPISGKEGFVSGREHTAEAAAAYAGHSHLLG